MTFRPEQFEALVRARGLGLGLPVLFRSVTGSTNDDALAGAREGAPHGALYVAEMQTAGRGRRGNRWYGGAGTTVLFTILLRPNVAPARASGLALVGGLAVRAAAETWLRSAGQDGPVLVKWPNDVVIGGRKLCGILAESQIRGAEVVAVALGVGLNLGTGGLPVELAESATSLAEWGVENVNAERVIVEVLAELEPRVSGFLMGGESTVVELRKSDALFGRRVRVGGLEGVAAGINRSGSLLLRDEKDVLREVLSGHVEILPG